MKNKQTMQKYTEYMLTQLIDKKYICFKIFLKIIFQLIL